ncbi:small integral membrane protein 8-like [Acropora palmata]|uniref:small integral membrane protein 8-like n=1 Tax=Acropora palmata TaxID=6131 RepID=UPI003D9FEFEE
MASTGRGGSSRTRQSSFAFRLINPELFIKPNKVVMVSGTVAIIGCVLLLGYMNLTGGDKGTVSMSVQNGKFVKSKWD